MPKNSISTYSFAAGIISPEIWGQLDFSRQAIGLKDANNCIISTSGSCSKRPGRRYLNNAKGKNNLIDFSYNVNQGYALEFGDYYIRFYRDGAILLETGSDAWVTSTAYVVGNFVTENSITYYCISNHTSGTFATDLANNNWVAQDYYEIPSPYTVEEAFELTYTQTADTLFIAHQNHNTKKLIRTEDNDWTLSDIPFNPIVEIGEIFTLTPDSLPVPTVQVGWDYAITVINDNDEEGIIGFELSTTADVELADQPVTIEITPTTGDRSKVKNYNMYRKRDLTETYFFIGTVKEDGTSATFTIIDNGTSKDESKSPPEEFTDFVGENNKPGACGLYNQRLTLGGTINKPDYLWMSRIQQYDNFTTSNIKAADEAISRQLNSGSVNAIKHFVTLDDLITFTEGDVWRVKATSDEDATAYVESSVGVSDVNPLKTRKSILFLEGNNNTVSDFVYSRDVSGYDGKTLDTYAKQLFTGYEIVDSAFSNSPEPRLYAIRNDGKMLCLTYLKSEDLIAWSIFETDGLYESITVVPKKVKDEIYVSINRDGVRSIEIIEDNSVYNTNIEDFWFVDSGLKYDGIKTTEIVITAGDVVSGVDVFSSGSVGDYIWIGENKYEILTYVDAKNVTVTNTLTETTSSWILTTNIVGGLNHLIGKTVDALADGNVIKNKTVDENGFVNLGDSYKKVIVGLPYTALAETIPLDTVSRNSGSSVSLSRRNLSCYVSVYKTRGLSYTTSENRNEFYDLAEQDVEEMNKLPELISDKLELTLQNSNTLSQTILLRQADPLPMILLSLTTVVDFGTN